MVASIRKTWKLRKPLNLAHYAEDLDSYFFGRIGTADDLIGMAVFLASAESDYIVAQTYNVDGGQWMS